jgi:S1 RNA binding domain protein
MRYQVGQRVTGVINKITDLGIFVTLPPNISGLVHHSDFGDNWFRERIRYKIGEPLRVVILHNYKGKIDLSKMRLNDPDLIDRTNKFSTTKEEDFLQVLNQTVVNGEKMIKKLQQELVDYAN